VRRRDPSLRALLAGAGRRNSLDVPASAAPVQAVPAVSGALFLLPRALFQRVGGFDSGYRLHVEDLDLCRRVRAAGGHVLIANTVSALHVRGVSSRRRPLFVEWHKHRGLWRYWWRHEAHGLQALLAPLVLAVLAARFFLLAAPRAAWRSLGA
jgi:N-acetylglucosaminyl-diphospho-decaprenol L-rhamnosyltransferase